MPARHSPPPHLPPLARLRTPVNLLFVHQNFPGQFKHLAPALAAHGHRVVATTMRKPPHPPSWQGVELKPYSVSRGTTPGIHPWMTDLETKTIRAEAFFRHALRMARAGFKPDVVIAHPGWGESLFVKEVWPQARLGIFSEFFYQAEGSDVGFDPEFPPQDEGEPCRLRMKNANHLLHFDIADGGISPTRWQASTFPLPFRERICVIHDGIDTDHVVPLPQVRLVLPTVDGRRLSLSRDDEVVTFVNRNLEPYRGYHVFMRTLPEILRRRPRAQVVLVGGEEVSYGARPPGGGTWKQIFIDEVRPRIADADWARVHFVGRIPYDRFVGLLQVSTVHVYLTYPFVLSWSLLEAMSAGCAIVASDTAPLREAIVHGDTGRLVGFFDSPALADEVCGLLDDPAERARLGSRARQFARQTYDLKTICLPRQLRWVAGLAA